MQPFNLRLASGLLLMHRVILMLRVIHDTIHWLLQNVISIGPVLASDMETIALNCHDSISLGHVSLPNVAKNYLE